MPMYYHHQLDPTGMFYNPLPEHPTREEMEEYQRLSLKMLVRCIATFFILLFLLALTSMLSGCATQKQEHQEQTHVVQTDSACTEHSHAGQVTSQSVNVDSIVTAILQRTREEIARQEQEHEITTETLTETIDSLGRVVRQSQKVTDRTLSRQEQQRIDRLEQTFERQIHQAILSHDSLWNDRFAKYQSSMRDSLQSVRDMQKQTSASNPVTWWQSVRLWIGNLALILVAVLFVLWLLRKKKWWLPIGE